MFRVALTKVEYSLSPHRYVGRLERLKNQVRTKKLWAIEFCRRGSSRFIAPRLMDAAEKDD
ncbi:hypothetical protein RBWH47_03048 [Rhodopirellula baltica WH47]|uniref:Uncharacterized protein n=1 Tax=Rhodopirellula baltica WH47 TaxID=991778 RepID=F2AP28_RHOBT|nr:hypothetical protein RBWH47_03048 [Rhodopirellula baltica WH47]